MTTTRVVIGRYFGDDSTDELRQADDGSYFLPKFIRDRDMDLALTPEQAMEWCDLMKKHGDVYRGVSSWPVKDTCNTSERTAT